MTPSDKRAAAFDATIWEVDEKEEEIEGLDSQGRPDPAYATALGLIRAPIGRRALAFTLDIVFWTVVQLPLWIGAMPLVLKLADGSISIYGFVNHPSFVLAIVAAAVTVFLTLVLSVLQLAMHGRGGMTIGKAIAGIRTVNVKTLEKPGIGKVLLRYLLLCVSGIVPLLGPLFLVLSNLMDPQRRGRGLHDRATGVWLIDIKQGLNPFDDKRLRVARKLVKAEPTAGRSALPSLATSMDPSVRPQYRPGERISAGVIGVARPYEPNERPTVGLPHAAVVEPVAPAEAGKPVLGGYRQADAGQGLTPSAGAAGQSLATPQHEHPLNQAPVHQEPIQQAPAQQPVEQFAPAEHPAPAEHSPLTHEPVAPAAEPAAQPAPEPVLALRFELRFDTGESILVADPVLLGRNPESTEFAGARPIALTDDSRSLSKTHMLVRPIDGGLEITDCRSTNGSGLIRAGVEYEVAAGVPVMTINGDTIRLGDRLANVVQV
ncbi:RDD family protein [Microbacterium sp.]|uniref:RDD family protein n=1 Tax=Microbacterium sp. TaxID=51671 RepID=UPI0026217F2C|nr:RDD family protein [Microbacterium sp.]